ncbi:hypothetical protein QCA50_004989 [Cerrena zonata]|uniref:Uncharacterized protein n=1 Tax=Cerrena zonata TaxID=2478898 RepID=A0AAW0GE90_9APHY
MTRRRHYQVDRPFSTSGSQDYLYKLYSARIFGAAINDTGKTTNCSCIRFKCGRTADLRAKSRQVAWTHLPHAHMYDVLNLNRRPLRESDKCPNSGRETGDFAPDHSLCALFLGLEGCSFPQMDPRELMPPTLIFVGSLVEFSLVPWTCASHLIAFRDLVPPVPPQPHSLITIVPDPPPYTSSHTAPHGPRRSSLFILPQWPPILS